MKKSRLLGAVCASVFGFCMIPSHAASVSYYLDQTNINPILSDGPNYLKVTMSDDQAGQIDFLVETLPGAFAEGVNFGIQSFGFNIDPSAVITSLSIDDFIVPQSWSVDIAPPQNNLDGFGDFDILVSNGGNNRQDPLQFTFLTNGTISDFIALSSGTAAEGNVLFGAHVADFITSDPGVTSAWFGGSTAVPVPAALWLFGSGLLGLVGIARHKKA